MKTSQALLRKAFGFLCLMLLVASCHQPTSDDLPLKTLTDVGAGTTMASLTSVGLTIGGAGPYFYSDFSANDPLDWKSMVSIPNHTIVSFTTNSAGVIFQLGESLSTTTPETMVFNTNTIFYASNGPGTTKCQFGLSSCTIQIH